MEKRGMIELHFNWIFILIAGAIILFFFINIVNKQREFSDIRSSGTIITNLESILIGAQISTNTVNIIDMPKVEIGFECNRFFIGPVPKQTKGNVIFSPDLLKGKELITWALDWNMPYRVTNFLYLTDPQLRYIIMDNGDGVVNNIFDELPDEMNKEIISNPLNVTDKNNYKVKFIFINDTNDDILIPLRKMPDQDVSAIKVDIGGSTLIPNTGTIEFFQKKDLEWDSKGRTFYLKKESLFGAIFSENIKMYECSMKKAFKKLNLVTKIYLNRSNSLADYYGVSNIGCASAHSRSISNLENMEDRSAKAMNEFPAGGLGRMDALEDYSTNIKDENQNAQIYSCVLIY